MGSRYINDPHSVRIVLTGKNGLYEISNLSVLMASDPGIGYIYFPRTIKRNDNGGTMYILKRYDWQKHTLFYEQANRGDIELHCPEDNCNDIRI